MIRFRSLALVILSLYGAQLFGADDPFLGTWALNSKSTVLEGSSPLPMNLALEIRSGDSGALVISMTAFSHAQLLDLEIINGYDRCGGEEHIVNFARVGLSGWPEAAMIPAAVRTVACIRFDGNRALSTTVRQDGKLIASSWRTALEDGRFLTEIRTGLNIRTGDYYRSVLVWDKT